MFFDTTFWLALLGIIWIDLLLSGDNAVVIALVCNKLPPEQRKWGIVGGAGAAIGLRVIFSFFIAWLMAVPALSIIGGAFLLYVAAKLLMDAEDGEAGHAQPTTLLAAITTIAIADVGMSLDNVMALAALSHGNVVLMALGVILSIPLVIAGSTLISGLIERFPMLTAAGAALLGWVAGGIIVSDPYVLGPHASSVMHYGASIIGAAVVLISGYVHKLRIAEPKVA